MASHGVRVVVTLLDVGAKPLPSIRTKRHEWFVGRPHQYYQVLVEVYGGHGVFSVHLEINGQRVARQVINTRASRQCWFANWPLPSGRMLMFPSSITQLQPRCSQPLLVPFGEVRVSVSRLEAAGPKQQAWAPAAVGASSLNQDSLCWGRTVEQLPDVWVFFDSAEAMFVRSLLSIPQHTAILRTSSHPAVIQALAAAQNAAVAAAAQAEAAAQAAQDAAAKEAAAQAVQDAAAQAAREAAAAQDAEAQAAREAAAAAQEAAAQEAAAREAATQAAAAQAVKERDKPKTASTSDVIDLTREEPVVRVVVDGREQQYDELAVCDLAAGDSEEEEEEEEEQGQEERRARKKPRWALVKKPVVDLVLEEEEDEGASTRTRVS